ncbi:MAG: hypothetical protein AAGD14_07405 [Planctomycetota bacterium]
MPLLLLLLMASPLDEARTRFETDLAAFAAWCDGKNLRGQRDDAYVLLLHFDPQHEYARKRLRYKWDKKQLRWVRKGKYRRPKDREGDALEEARNGYEALADRFVRDTLAALAAPDTKASQRRRARADLLAVAPEDVRVRELHDEVKRGDAWVLGETTRSAERAKEIEELVRDLRRKVRPARKGGVTDDDRAFGLPFAHSWKSQSWRVLGTVPDKELVELAFLCEAAHPMLLHTFGLRGNAPRGLTLYVLRDEQTQALQAHPAYGDEERKFVLAMNGSWVPGKLAFVAWSTRPAWRRDVAMRAVFGLYLKQRFGLTVQQGWAWEGFGSYLTYQLAGVRMAISGQKGRYAQDRKTRESQDRGTKFVKTDWPRLVRRLYDEKKAPDFATLLGKDVNGITADESLVSYALAEYLTTGFPRRCAALLKRYGSGTSLDDALIETFGFDLREFERRFVRWLRER